MAGPENAAMTTTISGFDSSLLLSYYSAQTTVSTTAATSAASRSGQLPTSNGSGTGLSSSSSATANDQPPWATLNTPSKQVEDAKVLSTTNFIDTSKVPLRTTAQTGSTTEQDNQKLFSLWQAVNSLTYLASMSQRSGTTAGQLAGFNTRFQQGLSQVLNYVKTTSFNGLTLQAGTPSSSATSTATVPFTTFGYTGGTVVSDANVANPLANVSASDSFNIAVSKGGATTNVAIDLSQVQGPLTIDNIVNYINQQLDAAGFSSRFQRTMTQGSIDDPTTAAYGITINSAPSETVSLSSADATPALYVAGDSGSTEAATVQNATTGATSTVSPPDQQGRLVKLTDLSSDPTGEFNAVNNPSTGNTTAQSTAVDANGDVYVVGNATGNFGGQINQGSQDVVLSKYDSAGNLLWQRLLGSSSTANAYSVTVNPTGGVVVAGSTTSDLTTTAIANGNTDSFVAQYDSDGNQTWVTQIPTLANNQANSVSVDSSGNVYIGGQVTGVVGSGQTNAGGNDAYLAKLNSSGKITWEQQFGTSGSDSVAGTATTSDGGLVVASVQNGDAVVTKYANGDATQPPEWSEDLGPLNNGTLSGITVSGNQVYVAGSTSNANLTANGQATVASTSPGGTSAFVFALNDNGSSATPEQVTYVGTGAQDTAGSLTTGPDGTVYLTGTTTGTFAGQVRNQANVSNMFVAAIGTDGSVDWTRQYGGADGQSTGSGIAVDPTGSSVLDALGLPRGTISNNANVDLTSQTTLRAGDSFNIQIAGPSGASTRTATITIDQGETLSSLVTKINGELVNSGSASVSYSNGAEGLKIAVNKGFTLTLQAGPTGFDALSRLGLAAGALVNPSKTSSTSSSTSSSSSSSSAKPVFGLDLTGTMDISTSLDAGAARAQLMNALQDIQKAYTTTNTPASSSTTPSTSTGTVSAATTAQLANYNLALSLFSSSSTSSSSLSTLLATG
jgi:hypothetical protein